MSTNNDQSNSTIDELFQQLLDGELEDVDVFLSRLDDDEKIKHAADIQLVHSMLLQMSDRAKGKNEQRVAAAMQRLRAETEPVSANDVDGSADDAPIVGRIGRFVSSPLFRWAAAACIVFAVIFATANISNKADASLNRMIQAAAINADRTYLITHDIGDGPPPSPFNTQHKFTKPGDASSKEQANNGNDSGNDSGNDRSKKQWPSKWPSRDGDDEKWEKMRKYWEAKRNSQRRDEQNDGKNDGKDGSNDKATDDKDRKPWEDKRRDGSDSRDGREGWGDRSRDDRDGSDNRDGRDGYRPSSKGGDYRGSHSRRPSFSFGPSTLYVRGENQFVIKRPMPNGELIVGSNGKQSWIVGPTGPVYVSDDPRTLCTGPQGDLALPFLNISEGLDQLKERYNIQKVADAPLPASDQSQSGIASSDDGRLYHRLDATKHAPVPGPNQISIWAEPVTNVVRKVILNDFGSRRRYGFHPRRIVFDLQSTDTLPADFFEHTAHHEADREVKTRQPRSHYERRR